MNKRDSIKSSLEMLADFADKAKDPQSVALYTCTMHLTAVLMLMSEEVCEALNKPRGSLLQRMGLE